MRSSRRSAPRWARERLAPALSAEHVAKSEQVAEDVVEIVEHRGVESAIAARAAGNSGVTEAVVARALLGIGENRVGFAAFLEALLGRRIVGIAVGMVLQSELAIGALDFLVVGRAADAQHFVVIAFYVGSQNCLPFSETDLRFGMASHAHHRRTQQPVLQLVAALQLVEHVVVLDFVGVHHLDRLVQIGIERFALRGDGLHP